MFLSACIFENNFILTWHFLAGSVIPGWKQLLFGFLKAALPSSWPFALQGAVRLSPRLVGSALCLHVLGGSLSPVPCAWWACSVWKLVSHYSGIPFPAAFDFVFYTFHVQEFFFSLNTIFQPCGSVLWLQHSFCSQAVCSWEGLKLLPCLFLLVLCSPSVWQSLARAWTLKTKKQTGHWARRWVTPGQCGSTCWRSLSFLLLGTYRNYV